MAARPLALRPDFDGAALRALAKGSRDGDQVRRLLALASIYDGGTRTEAAKLGGVGLQTIRDWVVWFNAEGPGGLINGKAPGAPRILSEEHRRELARLVDDGPVPAVHGVVRWRLIDLAAWLFEEHAITISIPTLSEEMRAMGYRRLSARPRHHAQNEHALAAFKKTSPPAWRKSGKRTLASR
jgi:transposase